LIFSSSSEGLIFFIINVQSEQPDRFMIEQYLMVPSTRKKSYVFYITSQHVSAGSSHPQVFPN
jgi:hypothetical protein